MAIQTAVCVLCMGHNCWGLDWAKQLELTTNTVAQSVQQYNSSIHATINNSLEFAGFSFTGNKRKQEKQLMGIFLVGMGEVQKY